jgi:hypothetical protein
LLSSSHVLLLERSQFAIEVIQVVLGGIDLLAEKVCRAACDIFARPQVLLQHQRCQFVTELLRLARIPGCVLNIETWDRAGLGAGLFLGDANLQEIGLHRFDGHVVADGFDCVIRVLPGLHQTGTLQHRSQAALGEHLLLQGGNALG